MGLQGVSPAAGCFRVCAPRATPTSGGSGCAATPFQPAAPAAPARAWPTGAPGGLPCPPAAAPNTGCTQHHFATSAFEHYPESSNRPIWLRRQTCGIFLLTALLPRGHVVLLLSGREHHCCAVFGQKRTSLHSESCTSLPSVCCMVEKVLSSDGQKSAHLSSRAWRFRTSFARLSHRRCKNLISSPCCSTTASCCLHRPLLSKSQHFCKNVSIVFKGSQARSEDEDRGSGETLQHT